jgi:hypothetical protein
MKLSRSGRACGEHRNRSGANDVPRDEARKESVVCTGTSRLVGIELHAGQLADVVEHAYERDELPDWELSCS